MKKYVIVVMKRIVWISKIRASALLFFVREENAFYYGRLHILKEEFIMILFTILFVALLLTVIFAILGIVVSGGAGIILFGDIIVCVLIIGLIIKKLFKKKKK